MADKYIIWWTNQSDCERVGTLGFDWPEYLADQFTSREGRAGRGRLWVSRDFEDDQAMPREAVWNADNPVCTIANDAAGIVMLASDYRYVVALPGFVTTFAMEFYHLSEQQLKSGTCPSCPYHRRSDMTMKERFCWFCDESMGVIKSKDYRSDDTCGKLECEREARYAELALEQLDQLDRDRGWLHRGW